MAPGTAPTAAAGDYQLKLHVNILKGSAPAIPPLTPGRGMSFSPSFNAGNSQLGAAPLRPRRSRGLREVTARSERRRSGGTGPRAAPPTPGTARLGSAPPRSERAAPQGAAPTPRGAHRPPPCNPSPTAAAPRAAPKSSSPTPELRTPGPGSECPPTLSTPL